MYLTTKIEKEHETVDVPLFCYCTVDTTVENSHQTQAAWKKKEKFSPFSSGQHLAIKELIMVFFTAWH